MNDRRMNELVRMAMEVDELERDAGSGGSVPHLRLVGAEYDHPQPTRAWWIGASAAAAALLAMAAALPLMLSPPASTDATRTIVEDSRPEPPVVVPLPRVEPAPTQTAVVPTHVESPSQTAMRAADMGLVEKCVVVGIFRDERGAMHCVTDPTTLEWQGNKCLSEVTAQEMKTVKLQQPCSSEGSRGLVVAMAGPQRSLPKNKSEAEGLATCILGTAARGGDYEDLKGVTSAASGCLSPEVAVKIEAVGVR